jgi:hypothetical protein
VSRKNKGKCILTIARLVETLTSTLSKMCEYVSLRGYNTYQSVSGVVWRRSRIGDGSGEDVLDRRNWSVSANLTVARACRADLHYRPVARCAGRA